jgi:hypothetical protein
MNHAYSEDRLVELPVSGWIATVAALAPASAIAGVPQVVGACGGARWSPDISFLLSFSTKKK